MSEQSETVETPSPEQKAIEARALEMGWIPKEQFRGDLSKWTDAAAFVERGETLLPILQARERKQANELAQVKGALRELTERYKASQEAIQALVEYNSTENLNKVKAQRQELKEQLKAAKKEGDTDREVELQDQLAATSAAIQTAETKHKDPPVKPAAPSSEPAEDPAFKSWLAENTWFGVDHRKSALAQGIATELRQSGTKLVGKAFYDKVSEEVDKFFNAGSTTSRVEGGRNGSGSGGGGKTKSFASLPQEAKDACARFAQRVVGPGRAYAKVEDFQAKYAQDYFAAEQN